MKRLKSASKALKRARNCISDKSQIQLFGGGPQTPAKLERMAHVKGLYKSCVSCTPLSNIMAPSLGFYPMRISIKYTFAASSILILTQNSNYTPVEKLRAYTFITEA